MIDAIKKTMLAGLGAVVITKEKAEEILGEWVRQGKVTAAEAREMAAKLAGQGRIEFENAANEVQQSVKDLLEKAGMGQKHRIEELEKRLLALEVEVANIVARARTQPPQ